MVEFLTLLPLDEIRYSQVVMVMYARDRIHSVHFLASPFLPFFAFLRFASSIICLVVLTLLGNGMELRSQDIFSFVAG